jgi:MarR family transcriptional regulator, organic hydroperoxide resistance regulator
MDSESPDVLEENHQSPLEEIDHAIMQISWLGQRQFMQLLEEKRFCLTLPQFYTLIHLNRMSGASKMSDLAEATRQSAASLTGIVDRLLGKQLVLRIRHERDRRQVMVLLTPRGQTLIDEIRQARREQIREALSHLNKDDIQTLLNLLDGTLEGMIRVLDDRQQHNGTCH